jgi:hypothetical protein
MPCKVDNETAAVEELAVGLDASTIGFFNGSKGDESISRFGQTARLLLEFVKLTLSRIHECQLGC